ncbi:zinc finger protein 862-like [Ptychodera flava]|uniref:zinc finger protein 862-like n=1 Tax=Ptychodera flava TaxID=63121 RepID=UPI00396A4C0E
MALQKMNESVFSKLTNLFRNAHSIRVNSRPFKDYVWMSSLDVMKGVEVGETYRNDKACRQFITAISEVERERLQNETSDNKFISIVSDGSTDVSVIENEIVYIRSAREGNVKIYFCSLEEVKKADAAGIYNAITHSVSEAMGPESLGKVCLVHRLELAFKEAVKCKAHDSLMTLLGELYKMYHKSPLQRTNLKKAFETLGTAPVMPLRIGGTRWLSHTLRAIQSLWKSYSAIKLHLNQIKATPNHRFGPKAKALSQLMTSKSVVFYGHFLQDILATLSSLSLQLQQRDSSIYTCHEQLKVTITSLQKLETILW